MLQSYSDQLKKNRQTGQAIVTHLGEHIVTTLQDITAQIRDEKLEIKALTSEMDSDKRRIKVLKRKELVQKIIGVFLGIAHVALGFIPGIGPALEGALTAGLTVAGEAVKNYDQIGGCSFQCRIQKLQEQIQADTEQIKQDAIQIDGLEEEQTAVLGTLAYVQSLTKVDAAIKDPTDLSAFPRVLPQLAIDSMSQAKLEAYLSFVKTSFAADAGGDGTTLFVQLEELVHNAKLHISLIRSWFSAAAKRQEAADAEGLLQLHRDNLLRQALLPAFHEQQMEDALVLLARRACRLQQHSIETMQELRSQFQFWSLEECPVVIPGALVACPRISLLGEEPLLSVATQVASDIGAADQAVGTFLDGLTVAVEEQKTVRITEESVTVSQPVRYSINRTGHPLVFQQLYDTGVASVTIRIPLDEVNGTMSLGTDLYNVRMYDARVMVDGPITLERESVFLSIQHEGFSQILDKDGSLHEFTHASVPVPYGYYTADNCPTICACTYYDGVPDKDSLGMCPNFINYSPFGTWQVDLRKSGFDVSSIERIRFHFVVFAQRYANDFTMPVFAGGEGQQDPPPRGEYCSGECV